MLFRSYTPEHIETILRRAVASGTGVQRMVGAIMMYYGSFRFEHLHPLQSGLLRRKVRTTRRFSFPRENPFVFHARRAWEIVSTSAAEFLFYLELQRIRRRVVSDPNSTMYSDPALAPVNPADLEPSESCAAHSSPAIIPISVPSAGQVEHERHEHNRAA